MNLLALRTALKRYGFDDSDPLDQWINASYQEMGEAVDWTFMEVMTTVPTILGSNTIAFPADFRKIISLRDTNNQYKLKWVSRRC